MGNAKAIFEIPGIFIGSSHADHDGGGPGQGKKPAKRDKKSKGFPAIEQVVRLKSYGCIATASKENGINGFFHDADADNEDCPKKNFQQVKHGNEYKSGIKMEEDTVVLILLNILTRYTLEEHIHMVNSAAMKNQYADKTKNSPYRIPQQW